MTPVKFYVNWMRAVKEGDFLPSVACVDAYISVVVDMDHPLLDPELLEDDLTGYWLGPEEFDRPYILYHY